jgi:tetratricopeptide (TPR) repeat protein
MNKKILVILFFILASCIYGEENLTDKQKEAREWFEKAEKLRKELNYKLEKGEIDVIYSTNTSLIIAQAYEYYTKAMELDPNFLKASWFYRGNMVNSANIHILMLLILNYDKKETELDPNYAEAYYYCLRSFTYDFSDYEHRIKDLTKAIEINPDFVEAYNSRGAVYNFIGEYDKAINDFNKVIELSSSSAFLVGAYVGLAGSYSSKKNYNKAIEYCTKAIELAQDNDDILYFLRGRIYFDKSEYKKSINDFTKAIDLYSKPLDSIYPLFLFDCYQFRAYAYFVEKDYHNAIKDYTEIIELDPQNSDAYFNRGLAYALIKMPTTACDDLYQAGILYLKQNKKTDALNLKNASFD